MKTLPRFAMRTARTIARITLLVMVLASTAAARKASFRTYADNEGLTELTLNAVLQAHDGYLWVATTYGMFHFDGSRFRRYGVDQGLPSAVVQDIFQRRDGTILGITQSGFARLAGDRFERLDIGRVYSPSSGQVVAEDAGGKLYIGAQEGLLWFFNGKSGVVPGTEGKQVWSVYSSGTAVWYALQDS